MIARLLAPLVLSPLPLLAQNIPVPASVMTRIGELLPEQSNAGAAFASDSYAANLRVDATCTVDMVFLWEGAGYRNSAGWFTYQEQADGSVLVTDRGIVWGNASLPSAGSLATGDVATLRSVNGAPRIFQPGERIGFFLIADGWSTEPRVRSFTSSTPIPSGSPATNRTIGRGCYTTLPRLNPEQSQGSPQLARHVAMIDMPGVPGFLDGNRYLLTGFEDLNRGAGSDNDFNDLVYVLQATPFTAVTVENVFTFAPGDPDGDGVAGAADHFPNDPRRARVARTPSTGITMVGLEDEYPAVGDSDYNDCVVGYAFEVVSNAQGGITDILATFHLLARGSVHNHGLGLHLPGLPADTTGTLQIERFLSDAYASHQVVSRSVTDIIDRDRRRIADVFPYTMQALPATAAPLAIANTDAMAPGRPAASARVALRFDAAVPANALGLPPYDLWFQIHRGGLRDVHFPGRSAFAERQAGLPAESGAGSFRDANGYPFLLEIPNTWRFPLERVRIDVAYPQFAQWRNSAGFEARSWYLLPTSTANRVSNAIDQYVPQRDWTVLLPPQ